MLCAMFWKHESYGFTRWLQDNADVLGSVIGLTLENVEREQAAGAFRIDLVVEDEAGQKSNHREPTGKGAINTTWAR